MKEARALIQAIPANGPNQKRLKQIAEVQLLRDAKQFQPAYDLLAAASAKAPKDGDLVYEQAMLADKAGKPMPRQAMPQIDLKSPKITRKLTTEWFARRVEGRFKSCLGRVDATAG